MMTSDESCSVKNLLKDKTINTKKKRDLKEILLLSNKSIRREQLLIWIIFVLFIFFGK